MANVKARAKSAVAEQAARNLARLREAVSDRLNEKGCTPFLLDADGPTTLRDGLRSIAGDLGQAAAFVRLADAGLDELPLSGPIREAAIADAARLGLELVSALEARERQLSEFFDRAAPKAGWESLDWVRTIGELTGQHQELAGYVAAVYDAASHTPSLFPRRELFQAPLWSWATWHDLNIRAWFVALEAAAERASGDGANDDRPMVMARKHQTVMRAMKAAHGRGPLTIPEISNATGAMGKGRRIGEKTVREAVDLFIRERLADRPLGGKGGAWLTTRGLQIAGTLPES